MKSHLNWLYIFIIIISIISCTSNYEGTKLNSNHDRMINDEDIELENNTDKMTVDFGECKIQETNKISKVDQRNEECIIFQYNESDKILNINHINACFNCCPGSIIAEISINYNNINITEDETFQDGMACSCICLYDLQYSIRNVLPIEYTLNIIEPFTINLSSEESGTICFKRTSYPWVE